MKKAFLRFLSSVSLFISGCVASVFIVLFYFGRGLPDQHQLKNYQPVLTNRFHLENGDIWRDYSTEKRFFCALEDMPELLIQAFLVAEDRNFFHHIGIDVKGLARAAFKNTLAGKWKSRPMGASTITQQIVKNFFAGTERSFDRKIKEAIMALRLERVLSKNKILELYLNQIYLGAGSYGVVAAAETYFQKKLNELTVDEIAYLAALPKAPETYQSGKNPAQTKARRDWILEGIYTLGHINGQTLIKAKQRPISLPLRRSPPPFEGNYFIEATRLDLIKRVGKPAYDKGGYALFTTVKGDFQEMANRALRHGLEAYDRRMGYRGALATTTLENWPKIHAELSEKTPLPKGHALVLITQDLSDHFLVHDIIGHERTLSKQELLWCKDKILKVGDVVVVREKATLLNTKNNESGAVSTRIPVTASLDEFIESLLKGEEEIELLNPEKAWELTQIPEVTGGIVVMEASTGRVLALSGGYDFKLSQHNAATQALRQPGSIFKTFVYLAALERGYTQETKVLDAPLHVPLGFTNALGQNTYSPKNFSNRFYGAQTLAFGLSRSINVMTVRLAMQIGLKSVQRIAHNFGVYESMPRQLAMILGAGETTLFKLTTAFSMIANGGKKITPTLFDRIEDRDGHPIYTHDTGLRKEMETGNTVDVREQLAKPTTIAAMHSMLSLAIQKGTGRVLKPLTEIYKRPIFGKTGTSNACKDTWFVGFSGNLVVGVFIGYPTPKSLGETESGGRVATPAAYFFFEEYFKSEREALFKQINPL